jgi:hypothetical protein
MKIKNIDIEQVKQKSISIEFFDDKICLENSNYKKIFGKKFVENFYKPWKRGVVKVLFIDEDGSKFAIRGLFYSGNTFGVLKDEVGLLPPFSYYLSGYEGKIKLSKGSRFLFIWQHPNHMVRLGFRFSFMLGGLSIILGIISLYLAICG